MKKAFGLIFLWVMTFGCANKKPIGVYQSRITVEFFHEVILDSNQAFTYKWRTGSGRGVLKGSWVKEGKYIILNGNTQPEQPSIKVEEKIQPPQDSLYFTIRNLQNSHTDIALLILNDKDSLFTNPQGLIALRRPSYRIEKIKVQYLFGSYGLQEHKVTSLYANHFSFKLFLPNNTEKLFFKDEKAQIRGKKLILYPSFKKKSIRLKKKK